MWVTHLRNVKVCIQDASGDAYPDLRKSYGFSLECANTPWNVQCSLKKSYMVVATCVSFGLIL